MDNPMRLDLSICPAEPNGRDAVKLTGTPAELAPYIAAYLRGTAPGGAVLQWPVGPAWSELYLHAGLTLAENLESAWDELQGIGCPPAILSDDESAMARAIVPALLKAARDV